MGYKIIKISTLGFKKDEKMIHPLKIYNEEVICAGNKGIYIFSNNELIKRIGVNIVTFLSKPFVENSERFLFASLDKSRETYHIQLNQFRYKTKEREVLLDITTPFIEKEEVRYFLTNGFLYFRHVDEENVLLGLKGSKLAKGFEIKYKQQDTVIEIDKNNSFYQNYIIRIAKKQSLYIPEITYSVFRCTLIENDRLKFIVADEIGLSRGERLKEIEYSNKHSTNKSIDENITVVIFEEKDKFKRKVLDLGSSNINNMVKIVAIEDNRIVYESIDFLEDKKHLIFNNLFTKEKIIKEIKIEYDFNSIMDYYNIFKWNESYYILDLDYHFVYLKNVLKDQADYRYPRKLGHLDSFIDGENIIIEDNINLESHIYNLKEERYKTFKGRLYYSKSDNVLVLIDK
ncbi:hypothetical protein [Alkaliphilus transvaalensis]|uniref:hypothetical protein n=1 Tax=Alkaliphilus transvaalensis TaxID=114628 RepID=UPI000478C9E2|nr:hypothetical protein [Alkaliphilus transvaalensis]